MANLKASDNPTFNTEMEAMERTTPGHFSEWNKRYQQLLDNDQYLKEKLDESLPNMEFGVSEDGCLTVTYDDGSKEE